MSLSPETLRALQAGRTLDAIKHVREETGLDLNEAKELIDIHLATNPDLLTTPPSSTPSSAGQKTLGFLIAAAAIGTLAYHVFVKK